MGKQNYLNMAQMLLKNNSLSQMEFNLLLSEVSKENKQKQVRFSMLGQEEKIRLKMNIMNNLKNDDFNEKGVNIKVTHNTLKKLEMRRTELRNNPGRFGGNTTGNRIFGNEYHGRGNNNNNGGNGGGFFGNTGGR